MMENSLQFEKREHIAFIKLLPKSPGQGLGAAGLAELGSLVQEINGDESVYVVVLLDSAGVLAAAETEPGGAGLLAAVNRPLIGAVSGAASGAGLELLLACDIRLASLDSSFAMPQVSRGMLPSDGGTQRLSRLVGKGQALQMILTGEPVEAQEALDSGLVNRLYPPAEVEKEAIKLAELLATKAPIAMRYCKEAVNQGLDMSLEQGLHLEADLYFLLHTTADRSEGVKSFLEKRKPEYKGE
jgi:enoyl-CoA hydratase/carnithine racemase